MTGRVASREALEHRLFTGASLEFQRCVAKASAAPTTATGALELAAALLIEQAYLQSRDDVTLRTIDTLLRTEQAWALSKTTDAVVRG